jgi:hypothetical protein
MPYELPLPKRLKNQGWKVKIREKERLEPPHVTLMCRLKEWRITLRSGEFLVSPGGDWDELDEGVRVLIEQHWESLQGSVGRKVLK